jgi:hypothetical protein
MLVKSLMMKGVRRRRKKKGLEPNRICKCKRGKESSLDTKAIAWSKNSRKANSVAAGGSQLKLLNNLLYGIQILGKDLVHCEHVDAVCLEDSAHGLVATDLALVARVL